MSSSQLHQRRGRRLSDPTSSLLLHQQENEDGGSSVGSPRSASPPEEVDAPVPARRPSAAMSKGKSLRERSKIPPSFAVTFGTILGLQCFSGMWRISTLQSWYTSLWDSTIQLGEVTMNAFQVALGLTGTPVGMFQYAKTVVVTSFCLFLGYVFLVAPALAGLWTGRKARRAVFHRYMGLSYLIHYVLACAELCLNYGAAKHSYLTHIVAVTGREQTLYATLLSP